MGPPPTPTTALARQLRALGNDKVSGSTVASWLETGPPGLRTRQQKKKERRSSKIEVMLQEPDEGRVWKRMHEKTSPNAENGGKKRLRLMRATGPETAAWREHVIPQVLSVAKHRDRQLMHAFDHWKTLREDKLKRQGRCIGTQCPICAGNACEEPH